MSHTSRSGYESRSGGILSSPPRVTWPDGVVHHGARLLLLLLLTALVFVLFPRQRSAGLVGFEEGSVIEEDVLAQVPFSVPKTTAELEREWAEVRASEPPTFDYRPAASDSMVNRLDRFFTYLDTALMADDTTTVVRILGDRSITPTDEQLALLMDADARSELRSATLRAARQIVPEGVADGAELRGVESPTIIVRDPGGGERTVPRDSIFDQTEFLGEASLLLPPGHPPELQQLLRLLLIQHLEYSLEFNVAITEQDRAAAARAVPTVKQQVALNEAIVRSNTAIGPLEKEVLDAYQAELERRGLLEGGGADLVSQLGSALFSGILLTIFGSLLYFFRREIYTNIRWVLLITVLVVAYLGAAAALSVNGLPSDLLPIAFVALAVSILWDSRMALVLVSVLAVVTGLQPSYESVSVVATVLVGGAAAALSVRAVRRRAQTWAFIAIIAAAYAGALVCLALLEGWEAGTLGLRVAAAGGNATLSAILAMGFLPVFEYFTRITTDQTLLEWADPNRSLLKRLSMEAPGTYAHTINVANLAESAASAIGANGLLCRVGLYYHDVGKMLKPHYFVENQPQGHNPHDLLEPLESAKILREHVVEGHRLAREAGVPEVVSDFVLEHHGTQLMAFFLNRAREASEAVDAPDAAAEVTEADFRYPGPRPRSKETAIAMLADSVESATRVLEDPTAERISSLIDGIFEGKIEDHQLDNAPLTLREIQQIKEQFVKSLSGIYHHRIDYPETKHLTRADASVREARDDPDEIEPAETATSDAGNA